MSNLIRLTLPSTTPEFQGKVRPEIIASRSQSMSTARCGDWESVALALGQHLGEGPDMSGEGVKLGVIGRTALSRNVRFLWKVEMRFFLIEVLTMPPRELNGRIYGQAVKGRRGKAMAQDEGGFEKPGHSEPEFKCPRLLAPTDVRR
ncbi:hypothetical protein [Streptomyces sp. NPDC059008]|uniref:hypothetical protein n=1 Tax=Streptomyces sp. NPDC059008 TaxID=3346693 RepID=UPI00369C5F3C